MTGGGVVGYAGPGAGCARLRQFHRYACHLTTFWAETAGRSRFGRDPYEGPGAQLLMGQCGNGGGCRDSERGWRAG